MLLVAGEYALKQDKAIYNTLSVLSVQFGESHRGLLDNDIQLM